MNELKPNKSVPDEDARFDRLVDGELTPEEYRGLLAALDDEPGGWRRCALAFLEAQALGHELSGIRRSERLVEPAGAQDRPIHRRDSFASWTTYLAMAASFLAAFGLGVALPGIWNRLGQGVVASPAIPPPAPGLAANPATGTSLTAGPRRVGNARLVVNGPGGTLSEAGELPIYELSGDAAGWLNQDQPALPAELVNELLRRGHQVERQQQFVPVDMEDGRQGIIPVEGYKITPVSRRAY